MFSLPQVPYLSTGLPGFLTPKALNLHINKHHAAYVDFANKNVPGSEFEGKTMEDIIKTASGPLFNNVAQIYNHNFFWECLTNKPAPMPASVLSFLNKNFGSVDEFKKQFTAKASSLFGSGWCYLAKNADGTISINQYSNALNPIKDNGFPILTVDTWEHSWYVDYENRKVEYFAKYWDCVNWTYVESRLKEGKLA